MSSSSDRDDEDTPLGQTEMQALRRMAEPPTRRALPQAEDLWASRYRILESLGNGGMGDVFLARDLLLDRLVALKVLRSTSDESFVDERTLLREARAAARAEHERVARVYDAGTYKDQAFIAMEYVRGKTLRAWMKAHRARTNEVIAIIQQLLEGLQALHERGLVHRDLKPENVMVTPAGTLRILDLGIARRVALADTAHAGGDPSASLSLGFGVGTPGYMAPEQWNHGDIEARADIFALGVIAYELVAGRSPFRGSTNLEIRDNTLKGELVFDEDVWAQAPATLKAAIRGALERDPKRRLQTVSAMAEILGSIFPPPPPPLSGRRAPSIRPPSDDGPPRESLGGSAIGMSVRAPATRRYARWAMDLTVGSALVVSVGYFGGQKHARTPHSPDMVAFSGGPYTMGVDEAELAAMCATYPRGCPPEARNEVPPRPVTIESFELDVHEATNEEFATLLTDLRSAIRVLEDDEHHYPRFVRYALRSGDDLLLYDLWRPSAGIEVDGEITFHVRPGYERLPVTHVTWLGARLFCRSLSKRLPTEAEWEYAARGVGRRPYPWGSDPPTCSGVHITSTGTLALVGPDQCGVGYERPFPIMSAPQDVSPEGIFDLGGNVAEWVDESAKVNDDEATYASRLVAESPGMFRGSAYDTSFYARTTARGFRLAFDVAYDLGFRCAKTIIAPP